MIVLSIFLFGLVIGSFLNALIWRLDSKVPVWRGRSVCPACRHELSWQDLIPIVSFLLLRARCRYCKKPISLQYPLVELATGILFLAIFNFSAKGGPALGGQFPVFNLLYLWFIASSLIVIFVYDLKHYIIPDAVIYPAIALTFLYLIRNLILEISNFELLINYFLAGVGAATFFFTIYALSRGAWMGVGDVKLALLMGLMLGFPRVVAALFFAFFVGAAFGLFLVFFGKKQWKSEVPFGPFLVAGTFFALFWGGRIVNWYVDVLGFS